MKLSNTAIQELRKILKMELPGEILDVLSDDDLAEIGGFYLEIFCQSLKHVQKRNV